FPRPCGGAADVDHGSPIAVLEFECCPHDPKSFHMVHCEGEGEAEIIVFVCDLVMLQQERQLLNHLLLNDLLNPFRLFLVRGPDWNAAYTNRLGEFALIARLFGFHHGTCCMATTFRSPPSTSVRTWSLHNANAARTSFV